MRLNLPGSIPLGSLFGIPVRLHRKYLEDFFAISTKTTLPQFSAIIQIGNIRFAFRIRTGLSRFRMPTCIPLHCPCRSDLFDPAGSAAAGQHLLWWQLCSPMVLAAGPCAAVDCAGSRAWALPGCTQCGRWWGCSCYPLVAKFVEHWEGWAQACLRLELECLFHCFTITITIIISLPPHLSHIPHPPTPLNLL